MAQVYNIDVYRAADHLSKMRTEIHKAQSAGLPGGMKVYDRARQNSYVDSFEGKIEKMQKGIELDLPESHPITIEVPDLLPLQKTNNPECDYFIVLVEKGWQEVVNSQSSRDSGKLLEADYNRIKLIIAKMREHLDYLEKCLCGDWPESSPKEAMTGDGSKGV